jgi:hypothetical protein
MMVRIEFSVSLMEVGDKRECASAPGEIRESDFIRLAKIPEVKERENAHFFFAESVLFHFLGGFFF